jgi:hypothetical protein
MKNQTCCFTGHRKIPKNEISKIKKRLGIEVKHLINQGIKYFGVAELWALMQFVLFVF